MEEPKVTAKTAVGTTLELRKAGVIVELNNSKIIYSAYTALGVTKPLLGREALRELGVETK